MRKSIEEEKLRYAQALIEQKTNSVNLRGELKRAIFMKLPHYFGSILALYLGVTYSILALIIFGSFGIGFLIRDYFWLYQINYSYNIQAEFINWSHVEGVLNESK